MPVVAEKCRGWGWGSQSEARESASRLESSGPARCVLNGNESPSDSRPSAGNLKVRLESECVSSSEPGARDLCASQVPRQLYIAETCY